MYSINLLQEVQRMVKHEILQVWSTGTNPEDLVDSWFSFSEDPVILCSDPLHQTILLFCPKLCRRSCEDA